MPNDREHIPAQLERGLMIDAGYRCAIPTCRNVAPLELEHIEDYAKVQRHEFSNMLVLCANCHGLQGEGPRKLDRKAVKQVKSNLSLMNGRYNDIERRVSEYFAKSPHENPHVELPGTTVLYQYLLDDGLIEYHWGAVTVPSTIDGETGISTKIIHIYKLTADGKVFVQRLREDLPIIKSSLSPVWRGKIGAARASPAKVRS